MTRFIVVSFGFLAFAFYQLSGGADFNPVETRLARIELPEGVSVVNLETAPAVKEQPVPEVTRISLDLAKLDDVVAPKRAQTQPARQRETAAAPEPVVSNIEEVANRIVLPSLVEGAATVTPVDFSRDASGESAAAAATDVRSVTGNRVNVRSGPSTNFGVVTSMTRGTQVVVLEDPGNGWVRLRAVDGGPVGWMADFLLSEG